VFYTIGQRHGLGIGGGQAFYVVGKDIAKNTVYVTANPEDLELETSEFALTGAHWIAGAPATGRTYQLRSRHRADLINGQLMPLPDGYAVHLVRPERAITPGQSAVVYYGDLVLGGGIIV
jgi:tRNA-specific 2-thiouridylase